MAQNKLVKNAPFYIFCTIIVSLILLGVSVIPFGNGQYDNQLYLATRDKGWDAVKLISVDNAASVTKAKEVFNNNIIRLHDLHPQTRLLGLIIKNKDFSDQRSKNKYIEMYTDFYNGSFFKDNEEMALKLIERNKLYVDYKKKEKELASYMYVSDATKALTNELYDINRQIELLDKQVASLKIKADNEYRDFTDRINAYIEKDVDIKTSK